MRSQNPQVTNATTSRRRLLVVDDEPIMAALLATALESGGYEVRTAPDAPKARADLDRFDPDMVVLDIALGRGPSGIDLAHVVHRRHPGVGILLLTKHPDLRTAGFAPEDLPPGCGFLRKESVTDTAELLAAVEEVLSDQAARTFDYHSPSGQLATLSPRQLEVLRMVAQGLTSPEIARRRHTTTSAVEKMLGTIYQALSIEPSSAVSQRAEAMRVFIAEAGLPDRQ